jgi:ABC-type multidrug transport system fused ATPase/permease subunit
MPRLGRPLDATPPAWRGVAAEDADVVTGSIAALLRSRSRRLLGSLLGPHKRRIWWAGALLFVQNAAALAGPYLVKVGIDRGVPPLLRPHGAIRPLVTVVVAFSLTALLRAVTWRAFILQSGRVGQDVLFDLRMRVFTHFQKLSLAFHERYTSGRVISRMTSDVEAISELLDIGLQSLLTSTLSIATIAGILFLLDVPMALASLLVFPLLVALTIWFRHHSASAYRRAREAVALVIVHFTESLGGIRAVHAFRREHRNQEIFEDVDDRYAAANNMSMKLAGVYGPGVRMIGNVALAIVLFYGGLRAVDGAITVGVLAAFVLYLRRFFEPMQELSQFYNLLQAATAALEKLSGVLEEEPTVPEPALPARVERRAGDLRLDDVHFAYQETEVLHGVDLHIPAGQTVAFVGETGAGKSTLVRLIARFYDPTGGAVLLDGIDLRDLSESDLRRSVAMVTQENYLFSGTVRENIAFGRPDAGPGEIEAAAAAIGAHEFIASLPDGYETDVRKRGGRLSAGQRQLVAFARAFLADPTVLILDEATSSLDIPSERLVQRALATLLRDRTAVIIAHRLTTVEIADRVLVVDAGRVVEDGSPADLIAGRGRYARLHRAWLESLAS